MFSVLEIRKLKKLVNLDSSPEDVLDESETKIITSVNLIKESFFAPKHNRPVKTVVIKKIFFPDFDLPDFIKQIYNSVNSVFELRIGLSFIAHKSEGELMYFFAIRPRPINNDNRVISNKEDIDNLISFFKPLSYDQLLNYVFQQNNSLNPFDRSGFRPKKLVLAVFWLTKYTTEQALLRKTPSTTKRANEVERNATPTY